MTIRRKILLLGILATGSLIYILCTQYWGHILRLRAEIPVQESIVTFQSLSDTIHELQKERGKSAAYLSAPAVESEAGLLEQRRATDAVLAALLEADSKSAGIMEVLPGLRQEVLGDQLGRNRVHTAYSGIILGFLDRVGAFSRSQTPVVRDDLAAHTNLLFAKEYLAQMRAILASALVKGELDKESFGQLSRFQGLYEEHLRQFRRQAAPPITIFLDERFRTPHLQVTQRYIAAAISPAPFIPTLEADEWFATATATIDSLKEVEDRSLQAIGSKVDIEIATIRRNLLVHSAAALFLGVATIILVCSALVPMLRSMGTLLVGIREIISSRDFSTRIPIRSQDEIGTISRSFNELLEIAERLLNENEALAITDMLTGIPNRLGFTRELQRELSRKIRYPDPMSLIIFDIDSFKKINDTFGHDTGDQILVSLADLVRNSIRLTDTVARWGGEEFTLLLPGETLEGAEALAEKLRAAIEHHAFSQGMQVTCSFGVAEYRKGDTVEMFFKRTDEALYVAKNAGRNQVGTDETITNDKGRYGIEHL